MVLVSDAQRAESRFAGPTRRSPCSVALALALCHLLQRVPRAVVGSLSLTGRPQDPLHTEGHCFSTRVACLQGTFSNLWDIRGCHKWARGCHWCVVG